MRFVSLVVLTLGLSVAGCKQAVEFGASEALEGRFSDEPVVVGPSIRMIQEPSDHKIGKQTQVVFEVVRGDLEIDKVTCSINSVEIPCDWASGVVDLVGHPLGQHWFQVHVVDVDGHQAELKEDWLVLDKYVAKSENFNVDQERQKTDILFVIDNSGSMKSEQNEISRRFSNFINQINGLDWHLGITTTDDRASSSAIWGDGRLDPFQNGDFFLTSSMNLQTAQNLFAQNVRRDESGSNNEKGILATYRSIERSVAGGSSSVDQALSQFFRKEAALAVVVVSDEDESGTTSKSNGDNLIQLVSNTWGSDKVFQYNSIITHTKECLDGAGFAMGFLYEALSKKTNGLVGDICSDNYSQMLTNLGKGVADLQKVYKLTCVPQDIDNDGKVDLEVVAKSGQNTPGYVIDKDSLVFDHALFRGQYEFNYYCLDE